VDLMKLLRTLHLPGTVVASRHKLERIMECVCVPQCVCLLNDEKYPARLCVVYL
jgi:hypothetical protein